MPQNDNIAADVAGFRGAAEGVMGLFLADLALIGETPAPTFGEEKRGEFLLQRLAEGGYQQCVLDATGTVSGVWPGEGQGPGIVMAVNMDTVVEDVRDQTIEIHENRVVGPFVGDNSIALAALTTLPFLLDKLSLRLKSSVHVVAATRCLGRGNLEGLRTFLAAHPGRYQVGLCLESLQLGRLNYACMGMVRGEIVARLPDTYDWQRYGATGTVIPMAEVVGRISRIPLPNRPLSTVIMGSIEGGVTYNNVARETKLRFELRSESLEILKQVTRQIDDITADVAAQSGAQIKYEAVSQRDPGGLDIAHPLVRTARAVLAALGVEPNLYATTSLMAALRDVQLPALTIGLTTGQRRGELDEIDESVDVPPIATGLAQVVALLKAIDAGLPAQ